MFILHVDIRLIQQVVAQNNSIPRAEQRSLLPLSLAHTAIFFGQKRKAKKTYGHCLVLRHVTAKCEFCCVQFDQQQIVADHTRSNGAGRAVRLYYMICKRAKFHAFCMHHLGTELTYVLSSTDDHQHIAVSDMNHAYGMLIPLSNAPNQ